MSDAQDRALTRAATAMPVIEGALAFIVISFVASVWENIPPDHRHDAFVVVFASGAHFMFSFLMAALPLGLADKFTSRASSAAIMLGLAGYVFWSLILQHRGLANLLLDSPWSIPIPFADQLLATIERATGSAALALYFGPLLFSYGVFAVAMLVLWVPSRLFGLVGRR